jgi:hypothetical protein
MRTGIKDYIDTSEELLVNSITESIIASIE